MPYHTKLACQRLDSHHLFALRRLALISGFRLRAIPFDEICSLNIRPTKIFVPVLAIVLAFLLLIR